MGPGDNGGHQNNVLVFELLCITPSETDAPDRIVSLGVHPFVVVPTEIRYQDGTRTSVVETQGSTISTKGGRALRQVSLSGTYGVESRGFGPYVGTGEQRFQRMWHEVVRLSDAVSRDQVRAELDPIRSPVLYGLLRSRRIYDPDRSHFAVNFFDLWHGVEFECVIQSFSFVKQHRDGGATGNTRYTMTIQEAGPLATGNLLSSAVRALFDGLAAWTRVNQTIRSYTTEAIADAIVAGVNAPLTQLAETIHAFVGQMDAATALLNGGLDPLRAVVPFTEDVETTLASHLGYATQMVLAADALLESLTLQGPPLRITGATGAIRWDALEGDGALLTGLTAADTIDGLAAVADAARFQSVVGALYGMSREEYAAYIASTGAGGRPTNAGTVEHVVTAYDSQATIERQYGVSWDEVLRLNDLLPDEALTTGRSLLIPEVRSAGGLQRIEDLPVFGSHAGRAAWGADLWADLRVDVLGGLAICSEEDALVQGLDWIVEVNAEELIALANSLPPGTAEAVVQKRIAQLLLADARIASVDVTVPVTGLEGDVVLRYDVQAIAINGGSVSTGATL